ncbi:hypothetical protein, partial [Micromonospora sp. NPDC005171]|uniref:hypothetical protein n=1 Tax=Micromonospora sp. NPDC005171 TaxID=3156866 RepID=UPI0033A0462B
RDPRATQRYGEPARSTLGHSRKQCVWPHVMGVAHQPAYHGQQVAAGHGGGAGADGRAADTSRCDASIGRGNITAVVGPLLVTAIHIGVPWPPGRRSSGEHYSLHADRSVWLLFSGWIVRSIRSSSRDFPDRQERVPGRRFPETERPSTWGSCDERNESAQCVGLNAVSQRSSGAFAYVGGEHRAQLR